MEVFVVHYDKLEVGRNECYATDAEVVGVFRQLCHAIRRAREKAVEILYAEVGREHLRSEIAAM